MMQLFFSNIPINTNGISKRSGLMSGLMSGLETQFNQVLGPIGRSRSGSRNRSKSIPQIPSVSLSMKPKPQPEVIVKPEQPKTTGFKCLRPMIQSDSHQIPYKRTVSLIWNVFQGKVKCETKKISLVTEFPHLVPKNVQKKTRIIIRKIKILPCNNETNMIGIITCPTFKECNNHSVYFDTERTSCFIDIPPGGIHKELTKVPSRGILESQMKDAYEYTMAYGDGEFKKRKVEYDNYVRGYAQLPLGMPTNGVEYIKNLIRTARNLPKEHRGPTTAPNGNTYVPMNHFNGGLGQFITMCPYTEYKRFMGALPTTTTNVDYAKIQKGYAYRDALLKHLGLLTEPQQHDVHLEFTLGLKSSSVYVPMQTGIINLRIQIELVK